MAGFTESGITLDFDKETWFRFQQSEPYCRVSGFGFKEMEACYVDEMPEGLRRFYAIELKDFSETNSLAEENMTKREPHRLNAKPTKGNVLDVAGKREN